MFTGQIEEEETQRGRLKQSYRGSLKPVNGVCQGVGSRPLCVTLGINHLWKRVRNMVRNDFSETVKVKV